MNILVIGGSGFIGTALIRELLALGYYVRNFDKNPSLDFSELSTIADVRDKDALKEALKEVDVVFNLAVEHRDDVTPVTLYYDVNVQGARNIVEAAELNNVKRIIFTSSVAVYGFTEKEVDESGKLRPFNDYGRTKLEAERPEGIETGIVKLVGTDRNRIVDETLELLDNPLLYEKISGTVNPYGDGKAAERIVKILIDEILKNEFNSS